MSDNKWFINEISYNNCMDKLNGDTEYEWIVHCKHKETYIKGMIILKVTTDQRDVFYAVKEARKRMRQELEMIE